MDEMAEMMTLMKQMQEQIQSLQTDLDTATDKLAEEEAKTAYFKNKVDELIAVAKEKDTLIENLQNELQSLHEASATIQEKFAENDIALEDTRAELTKKEDTIKVLEDTKSELKSEISELRAGQGELVFLKNNYSNEVLREKEKAEEAKKNRNENIAIVAITIAVIAGGYYTITSDRVTSDFMYIPLAIKQYCKGFGGFVAFTVFIINLINVYKLYSALSFIETVITIILQCTLSVIISASIISQFTQYNVFAISYLLEGFIIVAGGIIIKLKLKDKKKGQRNDSK